MKKTVWIRNFLQKMYDRESFFYKFVEWTSDIRFQFASWVWEQDCLETILSLLKEDGEVEISLGTSYEEYITTVEVSKKGETICQDMKELLILQEHHGRIQVGQEFQT